MRLPTESYLEQRARWPQRGRLDEPASLLTPRERVYPVGDPEVAAKLGLD